MFVELRSAHSLVLYLLRAPPFTAGTGSLIAHSVPLLHLSPGTTCLLRPGPELSNGTQDEQGDVAPARSWSRATPHTLHLPHLSGRISPMFHTWEPWASSKLSDRPRFHSWQVAEEGWLLGAVPPR